MIEYRSKEYFTVHARKWMSESYTDDSYSYSTPKQRIKVVKNILSEQRNINTILDVGCGGGLVSIELAKHGYNVTAVDQSLEMLEIARDNISKQSDAVQKRICLKQGDADTVWGEEYDCVIAMGLIGYLDSDERLFAPARQNLKKGGLFVVSFRNRLFNLFSLTHRTLNEIQSGNFVQLLEEAKTYYHKLSRTDTLAFLEAIHHSSGILLGRLQQETKCHAAEETLPVDVETRLECEPRQTTPKEATDTAEKTGFSVMGYTGVHPHFALPGANQCLPEQVYNRISDSLCPFEKSSLALLWSSVFIGAFRRR